ncbi:TPA: restriction endonuclease subunit S [Klebsiella aerogenes]|uniref:restriction endonuclease subunit S n=1 Tax=Klebsiella aerogenes TaxID=548 RepID=UPI0007AA0C0C|nr:restriction endonuclease subunit S [Klebsiella aerogenes]EKU7555556.1 restriction endonuclease subunit S [Klebsiella aerogenes]EKZ9812003.1 restriction endonuclease subunit S [Klebsiella aerogenes]SAJ04540.1 restriction modification system DNA specificity domain-containing protein [Klebsiella aerogenes]HBT2489461.1 restriction endonuclease subunit S [Klebsiella aerogenes]HBT2499886.1 restriction endonuclease subunit S [Klebsiella aerogenes]
MAKYKAYPEYKDSGVEWLGEIPNHWIRSKFGYLKTILTDYTANGSFADLKSNVTYLDEPSYARLVRLTDLRHDLNNSNGVWIDKNSYNYLGKSSLYGGEFLLANVGAYAGLFYQMPYNKGPASLAPNMFMAKFSPEKTSRKFIAYVGQADNISKQLMLKATASSAQPKLNKDDFKSIFCCYPPLNEQTKISVFLDHETAKIDNLIEKQQQLIELLKEKRQAVISHAVTKGLNPDVPMKDSGVEWLGKVPEHWTIAQLKFNTIEMQTGPFGSQLHAEDYVVDGIPLINPAHMNAGMIIPDPKVTVDEATQERLGRHKLSEGEIIFSRRGELGRCAVVKKNNEGWLCGTGSLKAKLTKKIIPDYAYTLISSEGVVSELTLESKGSTMANLNTETLGRIRLPVPPISEQEAILDYIKIISDKYDYLIRSADTAIRLMQERRTALISAAVTGKIDVRDWVAPDTQNVEEPQEATA